MYNKLRSAGFDEQNNQSLHYGPQKNVSLQQGEIFSYCSEQLWRLLNHVITIAVKHCYNGESAAAD